MSREKITKSPPVTTDFYLYRFKVLSACADTAFDNRCFNNATTLLILLHGLRHLLRCIIIATVGRHRRTIIIIVHRTIVDIYCGIYRTLINIYINCRGRTWFNYNRLILLRLVNRRLINNNRLVFMDTILMYQ